MLREIVSDEHHPIVFLFAGKAHPADHPAQEMMRAIHRFSKMPEFEGKVLLIEGYDLALARRLVSGVDVWLNTPEYPYEASGTSGQKAAMNGVLNLSVLDGWWGEGFDGQNGWGINRIITAPTQRRNREEARALYDILRPALPCTTRDVHEYSHGWVRSKRSMQPVAAVWRGSHDGRLPSRYICRIAPGKRMSADVQTAAALAAWKAKVRNASACGCAGSTKSGTGASGAGPARWR